MFQRTMFARMTCGAVLVMLGAGCAIGASGLEEAQSSDEIALLSGRGPLCPAMEALVSDEVSGPPVGNGEVIRFMTSLGQGTLTNNLAPAGAPELDSPEDMAFDLNGNVIAADMGITTGVSQVVRIDGRSGVRSLVSGAGAGSGPALDGPYSVAVERTGNILVLDFDPLLAPQLVRITGTGARSTLSSSAVGTGPAMTATQRVRVVNGVIYLLERGTVLSVNPVNGARTLVSGGGRGAGPVLSSLYGLAEDVAGTSVVVLDQNYAGAGGLFRIELATGDRTVVSSNTAPSGSPVFDMPFDVVHNGCDGAFYVLHSAGFAGPVGNVLKVDGATGSRTLWATYNAASPPSNYSLLMRPYLYLPGGGGGGSSPPGAGGLFPPGGG